MDNKKIKLGQFYTIETLWLKSQVLSFINGSGCSIAYDPFAGTGNLLKMSKYYGISECVGLDIDSSLNWTQNDSLLNIPTIENAIIITNPPYLSNYSASRKKVFDSVSMYFERSKYDDLYLIALTNMLKAQEYVVAIIPETFINSNFKEKDRLESITILEDNLFLDTSAPVCVACFNGIKKAYSLIKVYKNDVYVGTLSQIEKTRIKPVKDVEIRFNVLDSWLGLRAVDTTNPDNRIKFDFKENFDYDWDKGIKVSSRLLTTIDINISINDRNRFIDECNAILNEIRIQSNDIILSPFKGNMRNGKRRRRLDFLTARAIMEKAYKNIYGGRNCENQLGLFQLFN